MKLWIDMPTWQGEGILALGLAFYVAASVLSVVEEWPKQGLTDTSYPALLLWMVGGLAMSASAFLLGFRLVLYVGIASTCATSLGLGLKIRDTKNYRRHR
jgi:hypothetical protein